MKQLQSVQSHLQAAVEAHGQEAVEDALGEQLRLSWRQLSQCFGRQLPQRPLPVAQLPARRNIEINFKSCACNDLSANVSMGGAGVLLSGHSLVPQQCCSALELLLR